MKRLIFALIFLFIASTAFGSGELLYEGYWRMYNMGPSALTGTYSAAHIFGSDNLQYSTGSASLNSAVIRECLSATQGTIECWARLSIINSPSGEYWSPVYNGTVQRLFITKTDGLYGALTDSTATTRTTAISGLTWNPRTWHHIVFTWSGKNPVYGSYYLQIYADGVAGTSYSGATSPFTFSSIANTIYCGMNPDGSRHINGLLWTRILDRPLSAAEVTALYAAGAGSADSFIVTPDTKLLMLTSDDSTGIVYHHFGKTVSAIVAGATEATLTTAAGSDTVFTENDDVCVQDATGFHKQGKVDDTVASQSITVDDGAGAAVSGIETVGVSVNCAGTYYASGGDVLDITTEDFEIDFWMKQDGLPASLGYIVGKGYSYGFAQTYIIYLATNGRLYLRADDGTDDGNFSYALTAADYLDNKWHHFYFFADRSNINTCSIYIDGKSFSPTAAGTFPTLTLTNAYNFTIGARQDATSLFSGSLRDVRIHIGGTMATAAQILYRATHPWDVSASSWTLDGTREYWPLNENTGTTITAGVTSPANNLTLSNAAAWDLSAFASRSLVVDGSMESGGIGAISDASIDSTITVAKDTTTVDSGTRSQKIQWTASDDATALELRSFDAVLNQSYYYRVKVNFASIDASSDIYLKIDGSGSIVNRQLDTGTDDYGTAYATGIWLMYEGTFVADQTGAHTISFATTGEGAGANDATFYCDKLEVLPVVAGNALVAGSRYTLVYNTDTGVTGAAWSGLGSQATEVKAGDLYIRDDWAAASVATKSGFYPQNQWQVQP